ncbi:MAG: hypothetical protein P8010_03520 [Desulfosarcinaceae bacterium]|jgi:hypothetical protein
MSIRVIAKELYRARRREDSLAKEMAAADTAEKSRFEKGLRQARAERRRLETMLAGLIDRGAPSG